MKHRPQSNDDRKSLLRFCAENIAEKQGRNCCTGILNLFLSRGPASHHHDVKTSMRCNGHSREIGYISENVQNRANPESERTCNFESSDRVSDVVHNVIDTGPSGVGVENLERRSRILNNEHS